MNTFRILTPLLFVCVLQSGAAAQSISVGSKKFTENVILGEMASQLAESLGIPAQHRRELGGTRILWNALVRGDIDVYPEYTGTIIEEILHELKLSRDVPLDNVLVRFGIGRTPALGFNNTYAIGMRRVLAEKLKIRTITDLRRHPDLVIGFTNEFLDRGDGWPGLKRHYRLPHENVRGLDHDLAYRGLEFGSIHVVDMYSTDAEIALYDLTTLEDDAGYFSVYDAVLLYRLDLKKEFPEFIETLGSLGGKILR